MTTNPTASTNGQTSTNKTGRGPNKTGRQGGRGRGGQSASGGNNQGGTSRFMQGRQALGDAYGWASESAGRALPRVARYVPGQGKMRNLLQERPLVIGALGLGLGALIGMMLPSRTLNKLGVKGSNGRRSRQSRKS